MSDAVKQPPSGLQIVGLTKVLGGRPIVSDLHLTVAPGELVCLLGPSGCGKTTTLRMIGGFLLPNSGTVAIGGKDYSVAPPERRPTAMVFQNYALWPHLSVAENIAFGLKVHRVPKAEIARKISWALDLVNLSHHRDSAPARISGGEQQRVALARAIVLEPAVLLMDEPLSNLDAKLRVQVRETIRGIQQRLQITTVLVTHDQDEALSISDRVAVMNAGRIEQVAEPGELYARPETSFVAGFIGQMNVLPLNAGIDGVVLADGSTLPADQGLPRRGDEAAVRPEDLQLGAPGQRGHAAAIVERVIPRGHYREVVVRCGGTPLRVFTEKDLAVGDRLGIRARRVLVYRDGALLAPDRDTVTAGVPSAS